MSLHERLVASRKIAIIEKRRRVLMFVGSYTTEVPFVKGGTNAKLGEGVVCFALGFEGERLTLERVELGGGLTAADFGENPTYIAAGRMGAGLIVVNERYASADGAAYPANGIRAFAVDRDADDAIALRALGAAAVDGIACCHCSVREERGAIFAANYMSGSICAFAIDRTTGGLGERTAWVQLPPVEGSAGDGRDVERQEGPHAHQTLVLPGFDGDGDAVAVPDLGGDVVRLYDVVPTADDPTQHTLAAEAVQSLPLPKGSGPRHCVESPCARWLYVVCELSSTVVVFPRLEEGLAAHSAARFDPAAAHAPVSTLPPRGSDVRHSSAAESTTAAIRVHPSGEYVYVSNRGHDSIAVLAVDARSGALTRVANVPTEGGAPRDFVLVTPSPTSPTFLLAANQNTDTIVGFVIAKSDGGVPRRVEGCTAECNTPVSLLVVR